MKLFIDSSTFYLYLAVVDTNQTYYFTRYGKNDHSETLVDFLSAFLNAHQISIQEIKEVYVGRGPGSYTGLRIAGTVGKVLASIKDLPFYSFSSLDLLVSKYDNQEGKYLTRIVAKKNHSYIKAFTISNGQIITDLSDSFVNDEELVKYQDYEMIEVNDDFFNNGDELANNLIKHQLFEKADTLTYTPNYLRGEFQ